MCIEAIQGCRQLFTTMASNCAKGNKKAKAKTNSTLWGLGFTLNCFSIRQHSCTCPHGLLQCKCGIPAHILMASCSASAAFPHQDGRPPHSSLDDPSATILHDDGGSLVLDTWCNGQWCSIRQHRDGTVRVQDSWGMRQGMRHGIYRSACSLV